MKRIFALMLTVLLLCSAAACTKREAEAEQPEATAAPTPAATPKPAAEPTQAPAPEETPEPTPEATPEPVKEEEPPYRDMFNGAARTEPNTERPFAVMINNIKEAQPQCGISDADIIYEVLAEGGVTRMMAIFSDVRKAEHLGSVRSIRPYYIDISLAYGAVTCHAGGSDDAYRRLKNDGVENIDGVNGKLPMTVYYRDQARRSAGYAVEHTLFTEGENLYNCAEKMNYDLTLPEGYDNGLRFVADGTPENGKAANTIKMKFIAWKTTTLNYHEDTGLYTAQQHGGSYADGNTKEELTFRNVVAIWAPTKAVDDYGRLQIDVIGGGKGSFACGGKSVDITWKRDSVEDCFHYYLADGSELQLGEGTTYIAVLSNDRSEIVME